MKFGAGSELYTHEELLIPSILSLIKIAESVVGKLHQDEEVDEKSIEEGIRRVVVEYSEHAWKNGKPPLYPFNPGWKSPELEHDLTFLMRKHLTLSKPELTEGARSLLEKYEKMNVFSSYFIENVEKSVQEVLKDMRKEGRIKQR